MARQKNTLEQVQASLHPNSRLTVIRDSGKKSKCGHILWECKCSCGNEKIILSPASHLRCDTLSCGCYAKEKIKERNNSPENKEHLKKLGEANRGEYGESSFNIVYGGYKRRAKKESLEFSLTKEEFRNLTSQDCVYCNEKPSNVSKRIHLYGEYIYNGIDKIDPTKGYTVDNCLTCCWKCNDLKSDYSLIELKEERKRLDQIVTKLAAMESESLFKQLISLLDAYNS